MKKLSCVICVSLLLLFSVTIASTAAADGGSVTGVVQGSFPSNATLSSVSLKRIEVGTGVLMKPDGSAVGTFSAVLKGSSFLGQAQEIIVDGKVLHGTVSLDGSSQFTGIATVDLGIGTPELVGVPFSVNASDDSLVLTIQGTNLPATLTGGSITIE
jgi:hypothetical protein